MNYVRILKRLDAVNRAVIRANAAFLDKGDERYDDIYFELITKRDELRSALDRYIGDRSDDRWHVRYHQVRTARRLLGLDSRRVMF